MALYLTATLHIGPRSRNGYLVNLWKKLFRESFIPERRKFQIVIWFLVCSIGMFLVRSSAISSYVTDSNWCHMQATKFKTWNRIYFLFLIGSMFQNPVSLQCITLIFFFINESLQLIWSTN